MIPFLRKRGKILITHSLVNQLQCVILKLWLDNLNVLQFMKNLHWLMSNLLLESTLLIWLEIQAIILKFENTRLINKMKLEGHTLIWGHINLWCLNIHSLVKYLMCLLEKSRRHYSRTGNVPTYTKMERKQNWFVICRFRNPIVGQVLLCEPDFEQIIETERWVANI